MPENTITIKCRICGKVGITTTSFFIGGLGQTKEGYLNGTCNMMDGGGHHSPEELRSAYLGKFAARRIK